MKKLELLKTGASLIVSVGVGAIVGNLIKSTTPADVKNILKFCIGIGSLVLTCVASDVAGKYTEKKIDEAIDTVKGIIKEEETDEKATEEEA